MGAPFVRSPPLIVKKMLTLAGVNSQTILYDLGCGDGSIVIPAARDYHARKVVGIEHDQRLYMIALAKTRHLANASIINANYDTVNISEANVVTIYQGRHENLRLKPKFLKELSEGSTIVCNDFGIPGWRPRDFETTRDEGRSYRIFTYVIGFHTSL